jgi:hypothetical protein
MSQLQRQCPVCHQGAVLVAELHCGAECNRCRSIIEVDITYAWCATILLFLAIFWLFRLDLPALAIPLVIISVIYSIWGYRINGRWLPLKSYEK